MKNWTIAIGICSALLFLTTTTFGEVVSNEQFPIDGWLWWDPCNNEVVEVWGEFHEVVSIVCDPETGLCKVNYHVNAKGKGTGLTSGNTYVFNDSFQTKDTYTTDSWSGVFYFHTRLVTPDGSGNAKIAFKVKYSYDPVAGYQDEIVKDELICVGSE